MWSCPRVEISSLERRAGGSITLPNIFCGSASTSIAGSSRSGRPRTSFGRVTPDKASTRQFRRTYRCQHRFHYSICLGHSRKTAVAFLSEHSTTHRRSVPAEHNQCHWRTIVQAQRRRTHNRDRDTARSSRPSSRSDCSSRKSRRTVRPADSPGLDSRRCNSGSCRRLAASASRTRSRCAAYPYTRHRCRRH